MNKVFNAIVIIIIAVGFISCGKEKSVREAKSEGLHLLSATELQSLGRLGEPKISPDGKWLLYSLSTPNVAENKSVTDLYMVSLDGKDTRRLTRGEGRNSGGIWSPCGKYIAFMSTRSGSQQGYIMDLESGKTTLLTNSRGDIDYLSLAPDGKHFAYTSEVKLDKTVKEKYPDYKKANLRIYESLPARHWDTWEDENYSHLFVQPIGGGEAVDLMPGERFDTPLKPFGGAEQIAWSPDGKEIAYSCKKASGLDFVQWTNSEVYIYNLETKETMNISDGLPGYDFQPLYSPDGAWIAFIDQQRPGFESDRKRVMLYNRQTGEVHELSSSLDQWVEEFVFAPDSKLIYLTAGIQGAQQVLSMDMDGNWQILTKGAYDYGNGLDISPDGKTLVMGRQDFNSPLEFFAMNLSNGNLAQLTKINENACASIKKVGVEEKWITSTDGKKVQCWVIYPPDFDSARKYPMITYCQGGPQSMISPRFHYRWNPALMASHGYIVLMPNRRGVPGFGQAWNDAISRDWGGMPMVDILAATDFMTKEPYVDKDALAAVGASAGGYAVFWLEGNHNKRFKAFVAHSGVFNFESMYGSTEELWFTNWENGGPYWDPANKAIYEKNSPHKFAQNWDTPIMISAGERDFRVPYTQSLEAFTVAQVKGIPSKLVEFPEETHFISKPQNFIIWSSEFFGWLDKYCKTKSHI